MVATAIASAVIIRGETSTSGLFVGDFEAGVPGWQQFEYLQYEEDRPIEDSFQLVTSPRRQGAKAARITVRHGYSRFGWNEDTSLVRHLGEKDGDELWYAWSTYFPRDWVTPHRWGVFAEWHPNLATSPIIAFDARGDTAKLDVHGGLTHESTNTFELNRSYPLLKTLSKGRWNDFVMRVRWSVDREGEIEVFHRLAGQPALRRLVSIAGIPTFQRTSDGKGHGVYVLWGLYRGSFCEPPTELDCQDELGVQAPSYVYQDSFTKAKTYAGAVSRAFPGLLPELPSTNPSAVKYPLRRR